MEDVAQLRVISLARAERIAVLERELAAAAAQPPVVVVAAQSTPASTPQRAARPVSPRSRGQRTHRGQSPTARRRSSPIEQSPRASPSGSPAPVGVTSPRSPRSSRRGVAAHERFGPPPELPNVEPPPMPDTLPPPSASSARRRVFESSPAVVSAAASAPPPPLPPAPACDDCPSLRRAVAEQRDQIALLESSASRRKSDQEKLALLERQVDALAREIVAERGLRRELELANDRIARLTKLVDQVPAGDGASGMSTALFASATTSHADLQSSLPSYADLVSDEALIDEEAQRMATLPRFDADALRAAATADSADDGSLRAGLPAIIAQNAVLQRMAMQVAAQSLAAIEQSDGDGDKDKDTRTLVVVAGDAHASLGMQTLSRIKEMMAELLEDGRA